MKALYFGNHKPKSGVNTPKHPLMEEALATNFI
jgi:hypothetical protein